MKQLISVTKVPIIQNIIGCPLLNSFQVFRIRDSGSGAFLTPGSGMGKKKSGSGSGMNNQDHISESLETIFWGLKSGFRIRIDLMRIRIRIRIQHFF
jgi:hypothetical protein